MLRIEIYKKNVDLGEAQEIYIREKIEHLAKHSEKLEDEGVFARVDVEKNKLKTTDKKIKVEITIQVPHAIIRAEDVGVSMEEALANTCEKLDGQVEKYKSASEQWSKKGNWIDSSTLQMISDTQDEFVEGALVAKRKKLKNPPVMTEEEAINQMELLGHDFFVYKSMGDGQIHVVYKRFDETYGVIEVDETVE